MREWVDEKGEVLGWILALVPLAVIAGATAHAVWRGDPVDGWPLLGLTVLGVILLARDKMGGVKIGPQGIRIDEEEE